MTYSSITERAAVSEQLIVDAILPGLRGVKPNRARDGWTFYCPLEHRKKSAPAAIWVNSEGWISVHCFDCQRNAELREAVVAPHLRNRPASQPPPRPFTPPPPHQQPRTGYSASIWAETTAIPTAAEHPARRWFASRNLWRPEVDAPGPLRWLPAPRTRPGPHTGARSLVALLTTPQQWADAWPRPPEPQAVEIIAVDTEGSPALDRPESAGGLGKRTLGAKVAAVLCLGNPHIAAAESPVRVVEGVADALALAARFPGPVIATMGDAGMTADGFGKWLTTAAGGVVIHADNDAAGRDAASRLRRAILASGGMARAVLPPQGKDAGDVAGTTPFSPLTQRWPGYADTLAEMNGWPSWEAQRQTVLLMEGATP